MQASADLLKGIPQDGISLGSAKAPVRVLEFADLQCPFCRQATLDVLPNVIKRYVRPGQVRMEFHALAFIERAETGRLDRTEVYEDVWSTAIDRDEAEALLAVKPLDSSLCHENLLASRGRTLRLSTAVER